MWSVSWAWAGQWWSCTSGSGVNARHEIGRKQIRTSQSSNTDSRSTAVSASESMTIVSRGGPSGRDGFTTFALSSSTRAFVISPLSYASRSFFGMIKYLYTRSARWNANDRPCTTLLGGAIGRSSCKARTMRVTFRTVKEAKRTLGRCHRPVGVERHSHSSALATGHSNLSEMARLRPLQPLRTLGVACCHQLCEVFARAALRAVLVWCLSAPVSALGRSAPAPGTATALLWPTSTPLEGQQHQVRRRLRIHVHPPATPV